MSDFENGYNAYMRFDLFNETETDEWKQGYFKAVGDDMSEIYADWKETEE